MTKMLHLQRFFSMEQQKNAAAEEDPADDCLSTTGGDGDSTSAEGTTNNSISDDSGVPISSSNLNGKMSSNSNSLTNVMTTCDTKPPGTGYMSGEEYHPLNGCKSLNGISSLVG